MQKKGVIIGSVVAFIFIQVDNIFSKTRCIVFLFRVFVPEFSSRLDIFIQNVSSKGNDAALSITLGVSTLRPGSVVAVNCSRLEPCSATLPSPPWNTWVLVTIKTDQPNTTVDFNISANVTGS